MRRGVGFFLFAVLPIAAVLAVLVWSPLLAIHRVDVTGLNRTTAEEILSASGLETGMHALLPIVWQEGRGPETRLDTAARAVERLPWVDKAQVDWIPLHDVRIRVTERTPFARLPYLDGFLLVDRKGVALEKQEAEATQVAGASAVAQEQPGVEAAQEQHGADATQTQPGVEAAQEQLGADATQPQPGTGVMPVLSLKELRGVTFSGYAMGYRPEMKDPEQLDTGLAVLSALNRMNPDSGPSLYDAVSWVDVLAFDRVLISLDDRIMVRLDPTGDLQYMLDFTSEIFFRHISPEERGMIDFTRGEDPAFIPD